jgi:hypothetical protein
MAEHSLLKVHAHIKIARVGQHPTDAELGASAPPGLAPIVEHAAGVKRGTCAMLPPSLSLMQLGGPHGYTLPCRRSSSMRGPSSSNKRTYEARGQA